MVSQPIAVFDSGLGGLSVVRHLRQQLPHEDIVYFGDTARLPYGSKSPRTVITFARECAHFLLRFEPKIMVAACNTASALALDTLQRELPLSVVGVVKPGARAANAVAGGGPIAVLGTEATIASGAYERALRELSPTAVVDTVACPLLVPIVEEGRALDDPVVLATIAGYLGPVRERKTRVVVLGCTHYPLLAPAIAAYLGPEVHIVDSGRETAADVRQLIEGHGIARSNAVGHGGPTLQRGALRGFVSDNPARFRAVGARFLNEEIEHVELVAAEDYLTPVREGPIGLPA